MKSFVNRYYGAILGVLGCLSMAISFILGMDEGRTDRRSPVTLSCSDSILQQLAIPAAALAEKKAAPPADMASKPLGSYVGSKNGTKYYRPTCAGAKRIKPKNYIWFKTADDAKLQGYEPGTC